MSGGLAPSKSTVYVANIPFSLTNNDLHKLFEKYGKIVKVTIVKDKKTRKSRGVAFVLYLDREAAHKAVKALNMKTLLGRTLKCSIAVDNGRASEFIRRKVYVDKSRCFECGEEGHLSYKCPKNSLGDREPPKKKEKKRRKKQNERENEDEEEESSLHEASDEEEDEDPALESLSAAIRFQQEKMEEEEYRYRVATGEYGEASQGSKRKKFKKNSYFSDEEEISD